MHESIYDPNDQGPQRFGPRRLFKGGGGQTTTQEIPDELKPLASAYADRAMQVGNAQYQGFGGQRFADLNQNQNSAIGMVQNRAQNGSPVLDQANQTLIDTLRGGNESPYLDSLVNRAQQRTVENYNLTTKPQLETAMLNSGSFGNSGLQQIQQKSQSDLQQNLGGIATDIYSGAYNTDRANQMQALGLAPQYGNQAYTDAQQLLNAGNIQQGQQQQGLDFGYQQFQDQQNQPYKNLQVLGAPFTGTSFGGTTTTSGGGK